MKHTLLLLSFLLPVCCFAQQIDYTDFQAKAKTEINLQPEYGNVPKSQGQKEEDKKFIQQVLKSDTTMKRGSEHLVRLGFTYLYNGDIETAMRRFNQAWLLNPKNEDVYWGYGAVYFTFNDPSLALAQYEKGLAINAKSTNILTDKATIYMMMYQRGGTADNLNTAIQLFKKSYAINSVYPATVYKLSICYFLSNDCKTALKYYNECEKLGGTIISPDFSKALLEKCSK